MINDIQIFVKRDQLRVGEEYPIISALDLDWLTSLTLEVLKFITHTYWIQSLKGYRDDHKTL